MAQTAPNPQAPEPVATIRDLARQRVEETSLRQVARRVGMSPSGLAKFISGSAPYQKTVGRLEGWYLTEREAQDPDAMDPEILATAVRVLARIVAPAGRSDFVDELLDNLRHRLPEGRTLPDGLARYDGYMHFR